MSTVRSTTASGSAVYESSRAVDEYLQFHFGSAEDIMPRGAAGPLGAINFPARCARLCIEAVAAHSRGSGSGGSGSSGLRALDVGCAVGGATLELAHGFDEVIGIDFSQAFVDAAEAMRLRGETPYKSLVEGDVFRDAMAKAPKSVDVTRVKFERGDACNLNIDALGQFDAVLASNLLCRLPAPHAFLGALPQLVRPGGAAVIVSPYSWLEEYTPRSEWLCDASRCSGGGGGGGGGGDGGGGGGGGSFEALKEIMEGGGAFELESRRDEGFLIREHARKFQWGVSDATVWRRTAL